MEALLSSTSLPHVWENFTDRSKIPRYLTEFRSIPRSTRWFGQTAPILIPPPFTTGQSSLPPLRHWRILGNLSIRVQSKTLYNISPTRFAFRFTIFLLFRQTATKPASSFPHRKIH